jgi:hypothetical protein
VACLASAIGCGGGIRVPSVRSATGREMVRLERTAQRDMRCRAPLRVIALEAGAYELDGCGDSREYAHVCTGRRCVFQPITPAILRAAADLSCAPQQLHVGAQSPTHRAYYGCSRGAAYALVCVDHGCTWARTAEVVSIAAASAAPTPAAPAALPIYSPADSTLSDVPIPPAPGAAPPPTVPSGSDALVIPPPPS